MTSTCHRPHDYATWPERPRLSLRPRVVGMRGRRGQCPMIEACVVVSIPPSHELAEVLTWCVEGALRSRRRVQGSPQPDCGQQEFPLGYRLILWTVRTPYSRAITTLVNHINAGIGLLDQNTLHVHHTSYTYRCVPCVWRGVYVYSCAQRLISLTRVQSRLLSVHHLPTRDVQRTHPAWNIGFAYS